MFLIGGRLLRLSTPLILLPAGRFLVLLPAGGGSGRTAGLCQAAGGLRDSAGLWEAAGRDVGVGMLPTPLLQTFPEV